jgi:hypothetical protein
MANRTRCRHRRFVSHFPRRRLSSHGCFLRGANGDLAPCPRPSSLDGAPWSIV